MGKHNLPHRLITVAIIKKKQCKYVRRGGPGEGGGGGARGKSWNKRRRKRRRRMQHNKHNEIRNYFRTHLWGNTISLTN